MGEATTKESAASTKATPAGAPCPAPLSTVRAGTEVRVATVQAGCQMRSRLAGMGILPGMRLTVMRNTGGGPLVIAVHNARIALGRGMVHRILVNPMADVPACGLNDAPAATRHAHGHGHSHGAKNR